MEKKEAIWDWFLIYEHEGEERREEGREWWCMRKTRIFRCVLWNVKKLEILVRLEFGPKLIYNNKIIYIIYLFYFIFF